MNWVTFNYTFVYISICDAKYLSVSVHWKRFWENWEFWTQYGVTVVFSDSRNGSHLITHVCTYVFVTPSILQSYFIEKGFKKTENFKHSVVLLLFLFLLEISHACVSICICGAQHSSVPVHWERFQENQKFLTQRGVTVVSIYSRQKFSFLTSLCPGSGVAHAVSRNLPGAGVAVDKGCAALRSTWMREDNSGPGCCHCISSDFLGIKLCQPLFTICGRLGEESVWGRLNLNPVHFFLLQNHICKRYGLKVKFCSYSISWPN